MTYKNIKGKLSLLVLSLAAFAGITAFSSNANAGTLTRACYNNSGVACTGNTVSSLGYTNFSLNLYGSGQRVNSYSSSGVDNWMRVNLVQTGTWANGILVQIKPVASNGGECYAADFIGNNAAVRSKPCGGANQIWAREYAGAASYRYKQGNYCLNLPNANLANGGFVFMYQCAPSSGGDIEQQFVERNI
jgi:hypothetical protein